MTDTGEQPGLRSRLKRVGDALAVASSMVTVAPAVGGLAAFGAARVLALGNGKSFLIALFVTAQITQTIAAGLVIFDRVVRPRRNRRLREAEVQHSVTPHNAFFNYDPTNEAAEFVLNVFLVNFSSFPIRYEVLRTVAVVDDIITSDAKPNYVPGYLPAGTSTMVRFNAYPRGRLPRSGVLRGRVEMSYRYGLAGAGFAFESHRAYRLMTNLSEEVDGKPIASMNRFPVTLSVISENVETIQGRRPRH